MTKPKSKSEARRLAVQRPRDPKLKKCHFCGSKDVFLKRGYGSAAVCCCFCGARGSVLDSVDMAVEVWNQ